MSSQQRKKKASEHRFKYTVGARIAHRWDWSVLVANKNVMKLYNEAILCGFLDPQTGEIFLDLIEHLLYVGLNAGVVDLLLQKGDPTILFEIVSDGMSDKDSEPLVIEHSEDWKDQKGYRTVQDILQEVKILQLQQMKKRLIDKEDEE